MAYPQLLPVPPQLKDKTIPVSNVPKLQETSKRPLFDIKISESSTYPWRWHDTAHKRDGPPTHTLVEARQVCRIRRIPQSRPSRTLLLDDSKQFGTLNEFNVELAYIRIVSSLDDLGKAAGLS